MKLSQGGAEALHLVVTCSNAKRVPAPEGLRLRNLAVRGPLSPEAAVAEWTHRIETVPAPSYPAIDLYKGDRWGVIRELDMAYATWICSAGYGLVPSHAVLKPYGATFSPREADAVSRLVASPKSDAAWWMHLADWAGPEPSSARTITAIAAGVDRLVVTLSPPYLTACQEDLARARTILGPEKLVVVTSGAARLDGAVTAERRMLSALGGTDITLSVRLARWLVAQLGDGVSTSKAVSLAESLAASQPPPMRPQREPVEDAAVISFIEQRLADDPSRSATSLLREFRSELGRACEQKRFHTLVHQTKEALASV